MNNVLNNIKNRKYLILITALLLLCSVFFATNINVSKANESFGNVHIDAVDKVLDYDEMLKNGYGNSSYNLDVTLSNTYKACNTADKYSKLEIENIDYDYLKIKYTNNIKAPSYKSTLYRRVEFSQFFTLATVNDNGSLHFLSQIQVYYEYPSKKWEIKQINIDNEKIEFYVDVKTILDITLYFDLKNDSDYLNKYIVTSYSCFETIAQPHPFLNNETFYNRRLKTDVMDISGEIEEDNKVELTQEEIDALPENERARYLFVKEIASKKETVEVRIDYLKQIEGTPFAQKFQYAVLLNKIITNNEISEDKILGLIQDNNIMKCLNANVNADDPIRRIGNTGFTYCLNYLKSSKITARTTDGKEATYFTDINLSFEDYFARYEQYSVWQVDPQTGQSATRSYIWNNMLNEYPILSTLHLGQDDVYCNWFFVVIPKTYNLDTALKTMFNLPTNIKGSICSYDSVGSLTEQQYNNLMLNDYNSGCLRMFWENAGSLIFDGGAKEASFYCLYTDESLVEVADGGAKKGGLIGGTINEMINGVFGGIANIFGGDKIKSLFLVAFIIVGAIVAVKIYKSKK